MEIEHRRKAPRKDFGGHVALLFRGKMKISICHQLGEGGALIDLHPEHDHLKVGDLTVLTLFLPDVGGILATAQCVYLSETQKVGFQFIDLNLKFKIKIREFVSRRKFSGLL